MRLRPACMAAFCVLCGGSSASAACGVCFQAPRATLITSDAHGPSTSLSTRHDNAVSRRSFMPLTVSTGARATGCDRAENMLPSMRIGARPRPLSFTLNDDVDVERGSGGLGKGKEGMNGPEETPWAFILLAAAAILISYADRANLATCILPMANDLQWTAAQQGLVLSSFFAGYAVTQVVGGYLADRFGGSLVLQTGMVLWSVLTLVTPYAATHGLWTTVAARVGLGLGEGVAFPAVHTMIASYVPASRQSLAVGIITAASYLGAVVAFALTPWLIQHSGWPSVFYVFGSLPVFWLPFWWLHRSLTPDPTAPTLNARPTPLSPTRTPRTPPPTDTHAHTHTDTPLTLQQAQRLLGRSEIWAILAGQYTQAWGLYGLISWLPTYYNRAFGVEVEGLAAFTVAPYVAQAVVGVAAGAAADRVIKMGWEVRTVRRVFQTLGTVLPALLLVLATSPYITTLDGAGTEATALTTSFALVTVGSALSALTLASVSVNHLDVAPRYAGFVFGAGNTMATLGGLVSVPLSGLLLDTTGSFAAVFALFAAHYVAGAALYWSWVGDRDITPEVV